LKTSYTVTPMQALQKLCSKHGIELSYSVGAHAHRYLPLIDEHIKTTDGSKDGPVRIEFFINDPKDPKFANDKPIYTKMVDSTYGMMVSLPPLSFLPASF